MEQEFKWNINSASLTALAKHLHEMPERIARDSLHMQAIYYDTANDAVRTNGAALRIRRENDRSVCCMKKTVVREGAKAIREEYETEADTLKEGLEKLPEAGAPKDFCIFLQQQNLVEIARTDFIRNCYLIAPDNAFTAEFAIDVGKLGGNGNMVHFEEIELELKDGDAAAFEAYAQMLEQKFALTPQCDSKLGRALAAARRRPLIRNVIFDIGLVLVQFELLEYIKNRYNQEIADKTAKALWGSAAWDELDRGVLSIEEVIELFVNCLPECGDEIRDIFAHMGDIPVQMPYAVSWIRELKQKGYRVYYLSNYSVYLRNACPEALTFTEEMDGGIFSCDVRLIKPEPAIYQAICDKYNLVPDECVFIDDNRRNIEAAAAFGIHAIQFTSYDEKYEEIMRYLDECRQQHN
ncbi:MAG: HAD-IA family hydrolase [Oscillospiraceae bacterium]|nr:HAD-IA family hydrolase [Oscillospiraceae bacterium]